MKPHLYPEQELKRRAMSWALRLKVNPEVLRFESLTDKWGYCSPTGEVALALDLVDQDPSFQDYVIVHELLHLRVRSHGKRFKALLSAYLPDWRELEQHGPRGCAVSLSEYQKRRVASNETTGSESAAKGDLLKARAPGGGRTRQ